MRFDQEQTAAIEAVGRNILVSASAGAGKTGVLVARLKKRCIQDRIPLSRILAVTFTQAAAAEMKKRLAKELNEEYMNCTDPEMKEWLSSQLVELESAYITTIDSFCLTIIKKYCNMIGMDPAVPMNILDEGSRAILQKRAFEDTVKEYSRTHHEDMLKMLLYFSERSEDYSVLSKIAEKINNAAQSGYDPEGWYEKAAASYARVNHFRDLPDEILTPFFRSLILVCERMMGLTDKMELYGEGDPKFDIAKLNAKRNGITNCINALKEGNYSRYCSALDSMALLNTSTNSKNELYTKTRTKLNNMIKDAVSKRYDETMLVRDSNDLDSFCRTLIDFCRKCQERFSLLKEESTAMDFSDMERFAYRILTENDGAAASLLQASLDEIMVDEFQDTSELQNAVIDKLSNGHNVFRVGDVKQSIYRFRQAKPELMRSLMKDKDTIQITLRHNYRSKDSIVRYSNDLFSKLMNVPGSKDVYSADDTVSINSDRQKEKQPVPIIFAGITSDDTDDDSLSVKELKAGYIASEILRQRQDNNIPFRDFAVLVRSHADKIVLRRQFDVYGIPYDIDAREGFYNSDLCRMILCMTKLALDPSDQISLAGVLTSPFYGFSDQDMAEMKLAGGTLKKGVEAVHPEILKEFRELREAARMEGITAFLREISRRHDFTAKLPSDQKANFDFLYEKAAALEPVNLHDFLKILEAGEDERSSEASSRSKDDDVVTVTTIHQSKGLQYPFVFLWSTSKNMFNDARDPVVISGNLIGMHHLNLPNRTYRPTVQRMTAESLANIEDLEEFIRLLYVAVTRAENRLIIVDTMDEDIPVRDISLSVLAERKGMTGLILSALENYPLFHREAVSGTGQQTWQSSPRQYPDRLPSLQIQPHIFSPIELPSQTEVTGLPEPDYTRHSYGKRYGTLIHETIEDLPDTIWTKEDLKDTGLSDSDKEKLIRFSESDLYRKCLDMEIHKEYPFYVITPERRIRGVMDFTAAGSDEVIIIDFKTDSASAETIKSRYSKQLLLYKEAMEYEYPDKTVSVYAWSFHNDCAVAIA